MPRTPEEIFHDARELADPAQRSAFLDNACRHDDALRSRIEALLVADADAGDFLATANRGTTAGEGATTEPVSPISERPGSRVGPYKILQQIGEGGFGTVFLAEQSKPVRRRVALKIIKAGMDSKQIIARFEAERQALAMMTHPHIARVYDGGITDAGRPYFVMEYVVGDTIIAFADAHKLSIPDRLGLFAQVCKAVQHAHTKGIIHRDLKPGNVLVSMVDGKPFAKVIDFGIAKATGASGERLTDKTYFTQHFQLIGTLEYMSPEQAEGSPDIDTRSDVYSLGVLLYELLTGATPIDAKRLRSAERAELQRIIKEEEPPVPSLRLSRSLDTLASTAATRRVEPGRLSTLVRGELDWIVMKALDKDRARRYETASAMAADIQRHLSGEAVMAAPPSAAYRMRKFVRKHKAGSTLAAAMLLGIVGTTGGLLVAQYNADAAYKNAEIAQAARDELIVANTKLMQQTDEAQWSSYTANILAAASDPQLAKARLADCSERLRGWEWQYLQATTDTSSFVLENGKATVHNAIISPDGALVATVYRGSRKDAHVWDTNTGALLATLPAAGGSNIVAFSPDGTQLLVCGFGSAVVWDIAKQWAVLTLPVAPSASPDGEFSSDGTRILTHEWSRQPQVWDANTGELIVRIPLEMEGEKAKEGLADADFSADGTQVITAHFDHAKVWDATTGQLLQTLICEDEQARDIRVTNDGKSIMGCGLSSEVVVWDARSGEVRTKLMLRGERGAVEARFSQDGARIVTSGYGRGVRVWNTATGKLLRDISVERPEGWHAASFSPDATQIVVLGAAMPAVFDIATGDRLLDLAGHEGGISQASFGPDGKMIVTSSGDGTTRLWRTDVHQNPYAWRAHDNFVTSLQFSADGKRLLSATENQWKEWDTQSIELAREHTVPFDYLFLGYNRYAAYTTDGGIVSWFDAAIIYDPLDAVDPMTIVQPSERGHNEYWGYYPLHPIRTASVGGKLILTSTRDGFRVSNATTGSLLLEKEIPSTISAELSSGGNRILAVIFEESVVRIYDTDTGQILFELPGQMAKFDPTGSRILTLSRNNQGARIWDAYTGQEICVLDIPTGQWENQHTTEWHYFPSMRRFLDVCVYSPDGTRIVFPLEEREVGSSDPESAFVYDTATGERIAELQAQFSVRSRIAFSPDGERIATCHFVDPDDDDSNSLQESGVRLWDTESGKQMLRLQVPSMDGYGICSLAWSPDGTSLAAGGYDGQITIFDTKP